MSVFVREWKKSWRLWSVQLGILGTAITSVLIAIPEAAIYVWETLPQGVRMLIPENMTPLIGVLIFVLSLVSRLIKQKKLIADLEKEEGSK